MIPPKPNEANGKRLLMEAALRLSARTRSFCSLGIRELAREAGLNPNTFYRHFKDLDELGMAIIETMVQQLRAPLRELRQQAADSVQPATLQRGLSGKELAINLEKARRVNQATVKLFFDFVIQHPEAFMMGIRELHGASPVLRQSIRQVMKNFADDMADDIRKLQLMPLLDDATVAQLGTVISGMMFQMSIDYIEHPEQRDEICTQAESQILMLFLGALVLRGLNTPLAATLSQVLSPEKKPKVG